jgi:hypothetical protein
MVEFRETLQTPKDLGVHIPNVYRFHSDSIMIAQETVYFRFARPKRAFFNTLSVSFTP